MSNDSAPQSGLATADTTAGQTELVNVRKEYGDTVAVDGVSVAIEPGELLVLLGPSGCGKTTTLRMIAGLETPTAGTIRIDGEDETRTLPKNRDLSMVFQSYALYPHKTVRENLAFPLAKMDLSASERDTQIQEVANLLEITDLLDKQPGQLSGGQRQRVAVGRTIVRKPRLFLMDEPLSNLDAKLRVQTRSEIRDLQQRLGTTTVYVTHDQEEAMSIGDRLAIMRNGQIEQIGSPRDVYHHPENEFIAGFIGDPQINFIDRGGDHSLFEAVEPPRAAVRAGIRPEALTLAPERTQPVSFEATITLVEPVGHSYELTLDAGGVTLTALIERLPPDVGTGDTLAFGFAPADVYWFDDNGATIVER
ncbi:ABC transporter ATP-binding protein [Halorubrum sp. RMP-47]|uniref:ABC-type D-xylose/L-arabinose transporter n=1 Tax=Halorubrum miltondacostae TaxID=3076378 RepID=A0ABD5M4W6_9EURY